MAKNFHYHDLIANPNHAEELKVAELRYPSLVAKAREELLSWERPLDSSGNYYEDVEAFVRQVYPEIFDSNPRTRGYFRIKSVTIRIECDRLRMHYSEVRGDGVSVRTMGTSIASVQMLGWLVKSYLLPWVAWDQKADASQLTGHWWSGGGAIIRIDFTKQQVRIEKHRGV